jgi:hypothetical protein
MLQTFGNFVSELPKPREFLTLEFLLDSSPLKQKWRNNGLSADFMADYFSTFFPGEPTKSQIKNAVSFIANELLENTMKYGDETSPVPARVSLHLTAEKLIFITQNSLKPNRIEKFQNLIQEILSSDANELYIQRLEENAAESDESDRGASGLGILTMIMDYEATFGWKFETQKLEEPLEIHLVTTMVQLNT